jgi:DNA-binding MarR family transcriptional regulator
MDEMSRSIAYLMRRVVLSIEAEVNKHAKAYDLRIEEIWVLFRLIAQDNQTVGELAGETGIERTTLSRLLTRMQAKGLLKRRRAIGDQRAVTISLSDKGRALGHARHPTFRDYESVILSGISAAETQQLKKLLLRMAANAATIGSDMPVPVVKPAAPRKLAQRA